VRDRAREGVLVRTFAEAGGNWILFDVEQSIAILAGAFDWFGVEVVTPEVAVGAAESVDEAGVVALEVLHQAGDAMFLASGFEHEMDMVRHEAEGVDPNLITAGEDVEAVEVVDELGLAIEDALPLGGALIDVIDVSALEGSETRGQGRPALFLQHGFH
jgi:hypothetical protein